MDKVEVCLTLHFIIPQNGLNVNSLLYGVRKNMPKIFFAILKALFNALEEQAIKYLRTTAPSRFIKNGHQTKERHFCTSFGLFKYRLAQVRDKETNRIYTPLTKRLCIPPYRRCMEESGESGIGLAVLMSYRNSVKEVERITGGIISKSTLHRSLQKFAETQCKIQSMRKIPYRFLMVDGTKVTLQNKDHLSRKAEMRWALASTGENEPFDIVDFWIDKSWPYIYKDLEKRIDYDKLEVLFSDGGPGIQENLLKRGMRHQRCIWHGKRDFPYILYADGLKKKEQEPFKEKLKSIPGLRLRQNDLESLTPQDIPKVKELALKTKQSFQELLDILDPDKYPTAHAYIKNLARYTTTFFDIWLEKKEWIPLSINAIESAFSRVKNRIRFIGKRWSEKGLINWMKVWMNKVFFPSRWEELWEQYLKINPPIRMKLVGVNYRWL